MRGPRVCEGFFFWALLVGGTTLSDIQTTFKTGEQIDSQPGIPGGLVWRGKIFLHV